MKRLQKLLLSAGPGHRPASSRRSPSPRVAKEGNTKPRVAVIEFKNKADNQCGLPRRRGAAQDVFVTELVQERQVPVVEREQLEALMKEKGLTLLRRRRIRRPRVKVGKLLGVNYR